MVPLANPASTRAGRPQDAAAVETAIQRGVIVPARRVVEMVEDRIDGAHTNYVHNARRGGAAPLGFVVVHGAGVARDEHSPGQRTGKYRPEPPNRLKDQVTSVTPLDAR